MSFLEELFSDLGRPTERSEMRFSNVDLGEVFQKGQKGVEGQNNLDLKPADFTAMEITPTPPDRTVVALDSTSQTLFYSDSQIIGAIRAAIIVEEPGERSKVNLRGPYIIGITTQDKDQQYRRFYQRVFEVRQEGRSPYLDRMIDIMRNFMEKGLQAEITARHKDSLILLDGSLTSGTPDSPREFVERLMNRASENNNDIVAVSKNSILTVKPDHRSLSSILKERYGPCACHITPHIIGDPSKFNMINVYVANLARRGEAFRVDIPTSTKTSHEILLSQVASMVDNYGYPEELKMAHIYSVFSSIETLELQAASLKKYNFKIKEDIRKKIFGPWG